jgi:hypothetical protein
LHGVELGQIPEWAEEGSLQHRFKVDVLSSSVSKGDSEPIRAYGLEMGDAMDGMNQWRLPEWLNLDWRLTRLQQLPILSQFFPVNLSPRLDEATLSRRQLPAQTLDGVDGEHGGVLLVVRVKVRSMMLPARLHEHPDHDAKEARELGHSTTLPSSAAGLSSQEAG